MPESAARYRAISSMAAMCADADDIELVIPRMLRAAESALPGHGLEFLLQVRGDYRRFISAKAESGSSTEAEFAETAQRILSYVKPTSVNIPRNGIKTKAWAVPLHGSMSGRAALISYLSVLSTGDKEFLRAVADQFAVLLDALGNAEILNQNSGGVEKRIEEVSAIYEISQAVRTMPINDLLKKVTRTAAQVMDAEACSLMLKDPNKEELVIRASHGLSERIVEETRVPYGKGVAGQVALTGEPMLINDLDGDPRFVKGLVRPRPGIASSICVPLADEEGRVQGILSVRRGSPSIPFTEDDMKLFSVFAGQVALAISNAHLYASLQDSVQELSTLFEASRELSSAYSLDNTARTLTRLASEMTGDCPNALILLDSRQKARMVASSGSGDTVWLNVEPLINDDVVAWARGLRDPRTLIVSNLKSWPAALKPVAEALDGVFSRVVLVPLVTEDTGIGMLVLGSTDKRAVDQQRIRLLSIATSQAATIIRNATWHESQMEQKALELTALYQLSERISTASSLTEALDSILDIVRDIVWYDESFIATVDYERNVVSVQACRGENCEHMIQTELSLDEDSLTSWSIRERKALVSPDIGNDPRFRQPGIRGGTVRSLMAIPLIVHDEVVGVLNVHGFAPNLYTEENVRVLSVIASQAASLYKELEALSALANYTDNILRSIAAGVLTLDRDGRVLTWNKAAEGIMGVQASDAVDFSFAEVIDKIGISEDDKARLLNAVNWVMMTADTYVGYKQEYHPIGRPDLHINMNVSQLRDHLGGMLGLVIIFEDVTKEVLMENEMRRISELAAVGQLAASIAHEIRNPLSSIKGAAQYLRKEYSDHDALCEFLDIIVDEVNVLNKITTEFLDFARPLRLNLKPTDINDVIFRTLQFMHLEIAKHKVKVTEQLAYDMPRVMADDKQLEQVLRNIILNALQAMPEGGQLSVASIPAEGGVTLLVSDNGVGMSPDTVSQVFVPFFTTRTKGTGLGLSIVHKIMDNHGGRITVSSKPGEGTTFELCLPVCSDKSQSVIIPLENDGDADMFRRGRSGS